MPETSDMDPLRQLIDFIDVDHSVAEVLLEMSGRDVQTAVDMHFSQQASEPTAVPEVEGKPSELVVRRELPGNHVLEVRKGDICFETTEAIVNPANKRLQHAGGLAAAIIKHGGDSINQECVEWLKTHGVVTSSATELPTTNACVTGAGKLACRHIIHAVGPIWQGKAASLDNPDAVQLRATVLNVLSAAELHRLTSISIPAISTGKFNFPRGLCAEVMVGTIVAWMLERRRASALRTVCLTNWDDATVDAMKLALESVTITAPAGSSKAEEEDGPISVPTLLHADSMQSQGSYEYDSSDEDENDENEENEEGGDEDERGRKTADPLGSISESARTDVEELNRIMAAQEESDKVRAEVYFQTPTPGYSFCLWLALSPKRLLLDDERAGAWGLSPWLDLLIRLEFDQDYLTGRKPKVTAVVQAPPGCPLRSYDLNESVPCGLSFLVQDRLQTFFDVEWPPAVLPSAKLGDLREMCPTIPDDVLCLALRRCKCDVSEAFATLEDKRQLAKIQDEVCQLPSHTQHTQQETSSGAAEEPLLVLQRQASKGTVTKSRHWREVEAPLAHHNYLVRLLHFLEDKLRTANYRCLVCDGDIPFVGLKVCVCSKELCVFRFMDMGLGLSLSSEILRADDVLDLFVSFLWAATSGGRVSLLYPTGVRKQQRDGSYRSFLKSPSQTKKRKGGPDGAEIFEIGDQVEVYNAQAAVWNMAKIVGYRDEAGVEYEISFKGWGGRAEWIRAQDLRMRHSQTAMGNLAAGDECPSHLMDLEVLQTVLNRIPDVEAMKAWASEGEARLTRELDEIDDLIYPLLRWLVATNRAHLRPLKPEERFEEMKTTHQFVLMSGAIEREARFQELKRKHGSFFAWHGSASGNWHVILRTSLKNMSNTKFMSAGAAYGPGIYFANDASTSMGYSGRSHVGHWHKSRFKSVTCLALCEIIDDKKSFSSIKPFYVVPQEEYVTTRFFFVAPSNTAVPANETMKRNMHKFPFLA